MTKQEVLLILAAHAEWREDNSRGKRANLSRADLSEADLSEADLSEADLSGANLSGANLGGANLSGADLSEADLSRADLSEADLSWANLGGANLRGANLSGANLSGAAGCLSAQSPTSGRVTFFHPESDYVQSGCRKTTLAGFKAAVAETYPDEDSKARRGYEAIISLFEVYAKPKSDE